MNRPGLAGTVAALVCFSAPLTAQLVVAPGPLPVSCFDTLPATALHRVPVYLTVSLIDSTARAMGPDADLLAESVATEVRAMLGTHPDSLPIGEPRITWRGIDHPLPIVLYRNRPFAIDTSALESEGGSRDSLYRAGMRVLAAALGAVRAREEPFFVWPHSYPRDSLRFLLRFTRPAVTFTQKLVLPIVPHPRAQFLVFSIMAPWESEAVALPGTRSPIYPAAARKRGASAKVMLQVVINTDGRADTATIKSLRPTSLPPLSGEPAKLYKTFVESARRTIYNARFKPAMIGGCPVRVIVLQPYHFGMTGP